jgi:hypothetical protein
MAKPKPIEASTPPALGDESEGVETAAPVEGPTPTVPLSEALDAKPAPPAARWRFQKTMHGGKPVDLPDGTQVQFVRPIDNRTRELMQAGFFETDDEALAEQLRSFVKDKPWLHVEERL